MTFGTWGELMKPHDFEYHSVMRYKYYNRFLFRMMIKIKGRYIDWQKYGF